jgi:hypothetical protein
MRPYDPNSRMIGDLTVALNRLATVVEDALQQYLTLGQTGTPRYTHGAADQGIVGEKKMAELLGISPRTLAEHRRRGRLPGCWVKNGRRVCWMPGKTLEAWKRGIA